MKWVNINDKLPPNNSEVLVCYDEIDITVATYTTDTHYSWVPDAEGIDCTIIPSHWMPLPGLPNSDNTTK